MHFPFAFCARITCFPQYRGRRSNDQNLIQVCWIKEEREITCLKGDFFEWRDGCELHCHTMWNKLPPGEEGREKQTFQFSNFPSRLAQSGISTKAFSPLMVSRPSVWTVCPLCPLTARLGQWQRAVITVGGLEFLKRGAYWSSKASKCEFLWVQSGFESSCTASVVKSREFSLLILGNHVIISNKVALLVIVLAIILIFPSLTKG